MSEKRITVGICAYNEKENIGRLLDGLKDQAEGISSSVLEVIVVSSGSTDGTDSIVLDKARSFKKISLITEPVRRGKSNAQNIILSRAKGDIIVMISADSVLGSGALERLTSLFEGNIGGAKARAIPLNERRGVVNFASRFIWELLNQTNLYLGSQGRLNTLGGDMMALKTGIVDSVPENVVNDDAYLGTVVRAKGFQIAYVPDAKLYIRGPSTFSDFIRQRSRVLFGHNQLGNMFKVRPNVFENLMLSDPINAANIFIRTCSCFDPLDLFMVPFVLALELISQLEFKTGRKRDYVLWEMVTTSKERIPGVNP